MGDAARASRWSAIDGFVRAGLGFAITLVLARLVAPAEFGVMAIVLAFNAIAGVLMDSGLGAGLIQRQDVQRSDEATVFWFNLGVGLLLCLALVLAAPWIAAFFHAPVLTGVTRLMAVNLVIASLATIHTTLLSKALDFRPIAFAGFWSFLLSGALAIWLALRGHGVWSLAWQAVAQTAISTALLWTWHRWRPAAVFDPAALRRLFAFGGPLLAANLLDAVYTRLYYVFIGRLFKASDLGFYTRAQSTQQMPTTLLANILNRVALPAFSRAAADPVRLARALDGSLRLLMFINLPLMAGMAATARTLVVVLFGPRWLPAVPLLQVLCVVGALWPLQVLNVSALLAQGHSRRLLRLELLKKGFGVLALVVASRYGLLAIAWSQVAAAVFSFVLNAHYSGKLLGLGAGTQLASLWRTALATAVMVAVVVAVQGVIGLPPLPGLLVVAGIGALVFVATSRLLGARELDEAVRQLRPGVA